VIWGGEDRSNHSLRRAIIHRASVWSRKEPHKQFRAETFCVTRVIGESVDPFDTRQIPGRTVVAEQ